MKRRKLPEGTVSPRTPQRIENLDDLSPAMRRALMRCRTMNIRVGDTHRHRIFAATLAALQRRDLLEQRNDNLRRPCWKPTIAGRHLIESEVPRYLAARSQHGYTDDPAKALTDEPEAIDSATQERFTKEAREKPVAYRTREWNAARDRLLAEIRNLRQVDLGERGTKQIARLEAAVKSIDRQLAN